MKRLAELVSNSSSADAAFQVLFEYFRGCGLELSNDFRTVDVERSVNEVHEQLISLFEREPIPVEVTFLYFGLFDLHPRGEGVPRVGFYISGGQAYDPSDSDSLCNPLYFPENRLISSRLLDEVRSLALSLPPNREFLEYTVMFAMAAMLARFALPVPPNRYSLIVGFDEGDFAKIDPVR